MERFRCSAASADQPLAGTASVDRAYLLVENPGPWGRNALADSRLPAGVRAGLAERVAAAGVRVQLVRRHHRTAPVRGFRVFASYVDPAAPWTETAILDSPEELLGLDLAAVGAGRSAGLDRHEGTLLLVCTNGRRDACCAELGRPLVAALTAARPEQTWETTHVGGHRFAGAMLVLPHGLVYGRVDASTGLRIAGLADEGRLALEHLRGRAAYAPAVQVAEAALLEELGRDGVHDLRLLGTTEVGTATVVRFEHAGRAHEVVVDRGAGPELRQSCADDSVKATVSLRAAVVAATEA